MKRSWIGKPNVARSSLKRKSWTKVKPKRRDQGEEYEPDTRHCDQLFSDFIRERDNWCCVRCHLDFSTNRQALHCSHFINRDVYVVRYDPKNADSLCKGCHLSPIGGWEFQKKGEYKHYMIKKLGQAGFEDLHSRALAGGKLSVAKVIFIDSIREGTLC